MDRHEVARLRHREHELELLLARVPGHVHQGVGPVVHGAADLGERVDDGLDALLVSGDGRRADDDGVVGRDGERLVLACGHAAKRAQGLALATGAQHDDLVVRDVLHVVRVDYVLLRDLEVAQLARDLRVVDHGAAGHDHLAANGRSGVAHLLQPVDVAGERRHEHPARRVLDDVAQLRTHRGLGLGEARPRRVGGV